MDVSSAYMANITRSAVNQKTLPDMEQFSRREDIKAAAQDFEAVFITQSLKHMYDSMPVNDLLGGGHGEETFRTLLVDEYGKTFAKAGGVGIAQHVERELLALQEVK